MHISHDNGILSPAVERRLELRPDQAVAVPSAIGTMVECLKGPVWLTQEGEWQDFILIDGARFVSGGAGKIVISALDSAGQVLVYVPLPGAASNLAPGLHIGGEAIERAVQRAHVARAAEFRRMLKQFSSALSNALRRLIRGMLARAPHNSVNRPVERC